MDPGHPPLQPPEPRELTVAVGSLAIGGAERIVLDWAARMPPAWTVHLVVVRDTGHEWPAPSSARVTRLRGADVVDRLRQIGRHIAANAVPVCVWHLLTKAARGALSDAGAFVVPVVHNARDGWLEDASALDEAVHVVAVSEA